jgi:hypothetical protein
MTKKPEHGDRGQDTPNARPHRARRSVWDDAEIVVSIECIKPGTALDDHLRKEQTRALLDLLANYVQKLDENGDAGP